MITLLDICNKIFEAVEKEEYEYWIARREQFMEEGAEAVQATIEDDIAEGFYHE